MNRSNFLFVLVAVSIMGTACSSKKETKKESSFKHKVINK
jgi:hypothetical protein